VESGAIWGDVVGIRPLRPTDAGVLRRMLVDPELAYLLYEELGSEIPSTMLVAASIAANRLTGRPEYGIVERSGRLIGSIRLWRISEWNRSAMLTIYIGAKDRWGQGCGTDALRLILRQAFGPMQLHRVELHVFEFNARAIRSYEKSGFTREGSRRQALVRHGRYFDIVVMGILRDEFFARELERQNAAPLKA
jgi:RimJ/RimL family protein N-acetyltransferase